MFADDSLRALVELGFTPFFQQQFLARELERQSAGEPEGRALPVRVAAQQRGEFTLVGAGPPRRAILASRLRHALAAHELPTVGDWVETEAALGELSRIEHVFERKSSLRRKAWGTSQAQLLAANVDLVLVVAAFSPEDASRHLAQRSLNPRRLERYLVAVADSGARPLLVISKADLCADAEQMASELSRKLGGASVLAVSGQNGAGLDALEVELGKGQTAALIGASGAGKSTLTNRLLGEQLQRVHEIRDSDARGRHTTTHRELFVLPSGALLVDTPGMREFGLWAEDSASIGGFDEIDELASGCRFRDCRHDGEPDCAVRRAIETGAIEEPRLLHRQKLERELEWQRQRQDALARQQVRRKHKAQARQVRVALERKGRSRE